MKATLQNNESNFKLIFIQLLLLIFAFATSSASVIAALPAAINTLSSNFAAYILIIAGEVFIYFSWLYIGYENDKSTESIFRRMIIGSFAIMFALLMIFSVHESSSLNKENKMNIEYDSEIALYKEQEKSRISSLDLLAKELRATSKRDNPREYERLQTEISKISLPLQKPERNVDNESLSAYNWGTAAVFQIITPLLLLLAGMFSKMNNIIHSQTDEPEDKITYDFNMPQFSGQMNSDFPPTDSIKQLNKTSGDHLNDDSVVLNETIDKLIDLIKSKKINENQFGNITKAMLIKETGCTKTDANDTFKSCVKEGYLIMNGTGRMARYKYS